MTTILTAQTKRPTYITCPTNFAYFSSQKTDETRKLLAQRFVPFALRPDQLRPPHLLQQREGLVSRSPNIATTSFDPMASLCRQTLALISSYPHVCSVEADSKKNTEKGT